MAPRCMFIRYRLVVVRLVWPRSLLTSLTGVSRPLQTEARARAQGRKLGRPKAVIPVDRVKDVSGLSLDDAAAVLGVSRSTVKRWRR